MLGVLMSVICLLVVGIAAAHEFGALNGAAIACAIYLLMPYEAVVVRR